MGITLARPLSYVLLALSWAAGLYLFGQDFSTYQPWAVFLGVVLFSMPIVLGSLYLTTVRKIHYLAGFASQGWLYRLLGGRILVTLFWAAWAPASTFFLLLQFRAYGPREWFGFLLVIPVFYALYLVLHRVVRGELKHYRQVASALRAAQWVTPFVVLPVYITVLSVTGSPTQVATLGEAIAMHQDRALSLSGSALVHELSQFMAYYDGARQFVATRLGAQGTLPALLLVGLGGWLVFFCAATMLSSFVVPRAEYRRVFARLSDADDPPNPEPARVVLTGAIAVIAVVFVALPGFAALELHARQQGSSFTAAKAKVEVAVVLIDGKAYRPEVLPQLKDLQLDKVRQLEALQPQLERSLDAAFSRMEGNVEPFLDWYYQLSAEYVRTLNLLRGQLEDYVGERLAEYLQRGDPFGEFEALVAEAIAQHTALRAQFDAEAKELLGQHRLAVGEDAELKVVEELSLGTLIEFPSPDESIPLAVRAGTGGAAGLITAAVVTKVVAKLYAKGVIKLAAQPLAKALMTRAVAVGGGAAAGAAAGSVVPGLGTAAGAIVGAGIGLIAGIGMDYGLLKLEESFNRDKFRGDLLEAIQGVRQGYLTTMHASGS